MSTDTGLERRVAAVVSDDRGIRPPGHLIDDILSTTSRSRPRPRWLALIKEPPMRLDDHLAIGSPTARSISIVALTLALLMAATAAVVGGASLLPQPAMLVAPPGPGQFSLAPSMPHARSSHTATALADGRVLIIGGEGSASVLSEAEIRESVTGEFVATGPMAAGRRYHTSTLLDDGQVLVVGGGDEGTSTTAELWDAASGAFDPAGTMALSRHQPTATLLDDGRVLVVGGSGDSTAAELWDPASSTFSPAGSLTAIHAWHTATLLPDGRVLIVGGAPGAELFDPSTGRIEPAGTLVETRVEHTATLLADGSVLVAGGMAGQEFGEPPLASAELWDPETRTFGPASPMTEPRFEHTATTLPDGRVLLVAGSSLATAELFDPDTGAFERAASLTDARFGHSATLLDDGSVLVAGGWHEDDGGDSLILDSTEIWHPAG